MTSASDLVAIPTWGKCRTHRYDPHPTVFDEQLGMVNLLLESRSAYNLRDIESINAYGEAAHLDWERMLVHHAEHSDPLYLWSPANGRFVIEVEFRVTAAAARTAKVMQLVCDGKGREVFLPEIPVISGEWEGLRSWSYPDRAGHRVLAVQSDYDFEMLHQSFHDGRFHEKRSSHKAGGHRLTVEDNGGSYLGVALSIRLPDGREYEHKHAFRGRLGDWAG